LWPHLGDAHNPPSGRHRCTREVNVKVFKRLAVIVGPIVAMLVAGGALWKAGQ
jgi:hypothetical protein